MRHGRLRSSSSRWLYWTIAKRKIWKCREMGPAKKGTRCTRALTSPHTPPTSREETRDPHRHAQEHKRSHFALEQHGNDPMNADRTGMPIIPVGPWGLHLCSCGLYAVVLKSVQQACHCGRMPRVSPRGARMPLAANSSAMPRTLVTPERLMTSTMPRRSAAR